MFMFFLHFSSIFPPLCFYLYLLLAFCFAFNELELLMLDSMNFQFSLKYSINFIEMDSRPNTKILIKFIILYLKVKFRRTICTCKLVAVNHTDNVLLRMEIEMNVDLNVHYTASIMIQFKMISVFGMRFSTINVYFKLLCD